MRLVSALVLAGAAVIATVPAAAQPLGQFRWQQQPYCNILTLTVVQDGATFHLDGWDDQCGAPRRATAVGLAVQNPDGSIAFGLTIVTTPAGTPVHIDATLSLPGLSGTWHDSTGHSGNWTWLAGGGLGGSARPAAQPAFPAGLSAGNARITAVGSPAAAGDAANRGYVDAGVASARAAATAPLTFSALPGRVEQGTWVHGGFGCLESGVGSASLAFDLPLPIGARITAIYGKFTKTSPDDLTFQLIRVSFSTGVLAEAGGALRSTAGLPGTGFTTVPLFAAIADNTVRNDQTFYVRVRSGTHTGDLRACGLQVLYTMP